MTTFKWKSAKSGDWKTAGQWTPSGPPNAATADAAISVAGTYAVSLDSGTTYTLDSLDLSDAGATLNLAGTLQFAGAKTLNLTGGTLALSGTIKGATISNTDGTIHYNYGTLDGVTYRGTLDLSANNANVHVSGGITLTGASGTGAGAITIGNVGNYFSSSLVFDESTTLNNATVTLANGNIYNKDSVGTGQVLTMGAGLTLRDSGPAYLSAGISAGDSIVNLGKIVADTNGGSFSIGGAFTNEGSISIGSGDGVAVVSPTFSNTGTITDTSGGLDLQADSWANTGRITVTDGLLALGSGSTAAWTTLGSITATRSTVYLYGKFDTAQLKMLVLSSDTLSIYGDLVNTGTTLSVGTGTALGTIGLEAGTITGGVIANAGGGLTNTSGTLDAVTYRGTLNLATTASYLFVNNGITLTGASGSGAGALTIGSFRGNFGSEVLFENSTTLNDATITIGYGVLGNNDPASNGGEVLTLGTGLTLQDGGITNLAAGNGLGDSVVNLGKILASTSGGSFEIYGSSFTNKGTIMISNGDVLTIGSTSFSNMSGTTLNGGVFSVSGASTLEIYVPTKITTLAANTTLSGTSSALEEYDLATNKTTTLELTLATIGASGVLNVLGGRGYTTTNVFSDDGKLVLNGGTFASGGALGVGGTGSLLGYGTIKPGVANAGMIEATGGLLKLSAAVTGKGALIIENASTLELAAAAPAVAFAAGAVGALLLDNPASFTGGINGLALGDSITFSNETVRSAVVSGSTLTVVGSAGTEKYQVAGALTGNHFAVQADGHTVKLAKGAAPALAGASLLASAEAAPLTPDAALAAALSEALATWRPGPSAHAIGAVTADPAPGLGGSGLAPVEPTHPVGWLTLGHQ